MANEQVSVIPHGASYLKSMHQGLKDLCAKGEAMGAGLEPELQDLVKDLHGGIGTAMANIEKAFKTRYKDMDFESPDQQDGDADGDATMDGKAADANPAAAAAALDALKAGKSDDGDSDDDDPEMKSLTPAERTAYEAKLDRWETQLAHEERILERQGITV
jgi:hypothetical protein